MDYLFMNLKIITAYVNLNTYPKDKIMEYSTYNDFISFEEYYMMLKTIYMQKTTCNFGAWWFTSSLYSYTVESLSVLYQTYTGISENSFK